MKVEYTTLRILFTLSCVLFLCHMSCSHVCVDNFMDPSRRQPGSFNYDEPACINFELLSECLSNLRSGKPARCPIYDFASGKQLGWSTVGKGGDVGAEQGINVVFCEGTYALYHEVRHFYDLTVAVSGGLHFDLVKRFTRDIFRTRQTNAQCLEQLATSVIPMYRMFIEPDLAHADLQLVNMFNPFKVISKPIYGLKCRSKFAVDELIDILGGPEKVEVKKEVYEDSYYVFSDATNGIRKVQDDAEGGRSMANTIRVRAHRGVHYLSFFDVRLSMPSVYY